eukprot:COSAG05_NODE_3157_length_2280_cov_1.279688_3_plen_115_part_00
MDDRIRALANAMQPRNACAAVHRHFDLQPAAATSICTCIPFHTCLSPKTRISMYVVNSVHVAKSAFECSSIRAQLARDSCARVATGINQLERKLATDRTLWRIDRGGCDLLLLG